MIQIRHLKLYALTFVSMYILNFIARGFILDRLTESYLKGIRRPLSELNYSLILINFVFLSAGLLYLLLKLNHTKTYKRAAAVGGIIGFIVFLNVELTNMFLLPEWPLFVALSDTLSTTLIFALIGIIVTFADKKLHQQ